MAENILKPISLWTEEHDAFCLEHSITPSAKLFWQWLVYRGEEKEHEPDLEKEFNRWVAKKRKNNKPYDPKTLKTAIKQLAEHSIINIIRKFSWKEYRFFLRPLNWLMPKKKFRNSASISKTEPSKAQTTVEEVYQQQHDSNCEISQHDNSNRDNSDVADRTKLKPRVSEETKQEIKQLCQDADIQLPDKCQVFYYPIENIKVSLGFLKLRNKYDTVYNKIGWLINCLRYEYWEELENKYFLQTKGVIGKDSPFYDYYCCPTQKE
ncbi:MAG: hypothetical protein ACHBN1_28870 [Heteroscytonema crispum UTEX LB 1556]